MTEEGTLQAVLALAIAGAGLFLNWLRLERKWAKQQERQANHPAE